MKENTNRTRIFKPQLVLPNLTTKPNYIDVQWKPLIVITLGQAKSDNNNRMITITDENIAKKVIWDQILAQKVITISNLITLTVITLSGLHCTNDKVMIKIKK